MIKIQQNQDKQVKKQTSTLFDESFYFIPRSFIKQMRKLTLTTNVFCQTLFNYFSTETGRKNLRISFTITDLRKDLSLNDEKLISRNTVLNTVEEIKQSELFLVSENWQGKERIFTFYLNNEVNKKLFDNVKNNLGSFKIERPRENYLENNVIPFERSSQSIDLSIQSIEKTYQSFDTNSQSFDKTCQSIDTICQFTDNIANLKKIDTKEFEVVVHNHQENLYKENLYKEYIHKEEKLLPEIETSKQNILVTEISKKNDGDVKIFNEKEKEIKKPEVAIQNKFSEDQEKYLIILSEDFGFTDAEDILNQYDLETIEGSFEKYYEALQNGFNPKNEGAYLRSLIMKYEKPVPVALVPKKSNTEDKFLEFGVNQKFIGTKQMNQAFELCFDALVNRRSNKDLMVLLNKTFSFDEMGEIVDLMEKHDQFFRGRLKGKLLEFLNNFQNPNSIAVEVLNPKQLLQKRLAELGIQNKNISQEIPL